MSSGNDSELAVIGDKSFITGFRLAGVRHVEEIKDSGENDQDAGGQVRAAIKNLLSPNANTQAQGPPRAIGILIIQEETLIGFSRKEKEKLLDNASPVVMFVSERQEITLQSSIKRALGIDIMLKNR